MRFICPKYPFLTFWADDEKYSFYGGVFDLAEYPEEKHPAITASLKKTHPSTGVMVEQEYGLPFKCDSCDRRFETLNAKNGHKSVHKTKADIDALSWREGGAPRNDT